MLFDWPSTVACPSHPAHYNCLQKSLTMTESFSVGEGIQKEKKMLLIESDNEPSAFETYMDG